MTTGNTVALTVSVASAAPPNFSQTNCERLQEQNQTQREKAKRSLESSLNNKNLSKTDRKGLKDALAKVDGAGATFTSAIVNVGAGGGRRVRGRPTASSSGKATEKIKGAGGTPGMRTGDESVLCKPPTYKHPEGGAGAHAEAKIFNEMTSKALPGMPQGGSVLLNVNWRYTLPSTGKTYKSGMPCRTCFRMMCHAATKCNVQIFICDKENKPQQLKDECKNKKKGYMALDKKIDHTASKSLFKYGQRMMG